MTPKAFGMVQFVCIVIGSFLLSLKFGGIVGWGVGLISYALSPFPVKP